MARRVSRPLALRVTWVVAPWGVSAHQVTIAAWLCGVAAAAVFGCGAGTNWLAAAALLQVWYLLDHVDGQLARLRRTASLDGVQLDYLMHHTLNLLVPVGAASGLAVELGSHFWLAAGLAWGVGLLWLGLLNDTRYKAFTQRLKRVRGELMVGGGGGAAPRPAAGPPRGARRLAAWAARKACEIHVVMNALAVLAVAMALAPVAGLTVCQLYVALSAAGSLVTAVAATARSVAEGAAEREFAAWYRAADGNELRLEDGWWEVRPVPNR
jgi:phosphatidylglycerophosphate synthase